MVHNEMSFLFGAVPIPGTPPPNVQSVVNNNAGNSGDIFGTIDTTKYDRVYKDSKTGRNNVIREVQDTVYARDRVFKDPYVALLDYFNNGTTVPHGAIAMELKAADFVYLKDLGVYPINRLVILRRYRDGVVVPNNLSLFMEKPISTVIGWIKVDESNKELFSFNFNEKWVEQTDTLDKVIQKIMKEQFGIRTEMFLPIPAWSQGFLFGMLNKMKLTDYNSKDVPTGDPNVLRTSIMREIESQSLMSDLKINFETSYEQKYIDGVDPGLAFQDIIANLVRCGTSEMKFILNGQAKPFQDFFGAVLTKGGIDAWINISKSLIDMFIGTIKDLFSGIGDIASSYDSLRTEAGSIAKQKEKDEKEIARLESILSNPKNGSATDRSRWQNDLNKLKGDNKISTSSILGGLGAGYAPVASILTDAVQTLLAGSVYKYRWPLIGSIGVMSGLSTTPWHMTVGNPFSPILNMANIVVENVDLKFSSEMGFNDMPKRVDATIQIKMGRPLGSSEINRMFNNQYGRIYSKNKSSTSMGSTEAGIPTMLKGGVVDKRPPLKPLTTPTTPLSTLQPLSVDDIQAKGLANSVGDILP